MSNTLLYELFLLWQECKMYTISDKNAGMLSFWGHWKDTGKWNFWFVHIWKLILAYFSPGSQCHDTLELFCHLELHMRVIADAFQGAA